MNTNWVLHIFILMITVGATLKEIQVSDEFEPFI